MLAVPRRVPCAGAGALWQRVRARFSSAAASQQQGDEEVLFMQRGMCSTVVLNRPKALNSLNLSMIRAMYPRYQAMEAANSSRIVILLSAGGKGFCAGGDVKALWEEGTAEKASGTLRKDFFKEEYKLNHLIGTMKTPHVALLDGITMGGGVGISVHGRFRVATENTVFAMPETGIGFYTDVGGSYFLPRLPGQLGMYLGLTGDRLKGHDTKRAGVATHYVHSSQLPDLMDRLRSLPPECLDGTSSSLDTLDRVLCEFEDPTGPEGPTVLEASRVAQINKCFVHNSVEGIVRSLEQEGSDWAQGAAKKIRSHSPTSLKVVHRGLRLGAKMTLEECLCQEYRISQHMMFQGKDFYEGIRAVLVEKGSTPQWSPSTLEEVSDELVLQHFERLPDAQELVLSSKRKKNKQ